MRCEQANLLLDEYAARELLPLDRAAVEEHLETCATCPVELARLEALTDALEHLPEDPVGDDFCAAVMADLPEMLPAQEGAGHVARWGVAAAAVLVLFVAGIALLPSVGGPGVASETLQPLSASLRLGGSMLSAAATAFAGALDAAAASLISTGVGSKLFFMVAFVLCNSALVYTVHRYRSQLLPAGGGRMIGHG